jgi:hypothetical protein
VSAAVAATLNFPRTLRVLRRVFMDWKRLNQPLTAKGLLRMLGFGLAGAGVLLAAVAVYRRTTAGPASPSSVRASVLNYLKRQSRQTDFRAEYDFGLKAAVAQLRTNAARLQWESAAGRTNLAELQKQASVLRRELATLRDEERTLKQQNTVRTAQTNVDTAQTNAAAKRAAWAGKQQDVAAKDAALTAKQGEITARQTELAEKQKQLAALQKDTVAKESQLRRQQADAGQELRKSALTASSYEKLYLTIGQQLWLSEQFLSSTEPEWQRQALRLAVEASQSSVSGADDAWLSARICEGYLWPNLDLKDAQGSRVADPNALLQTCGYAFAQANEQDNVMRNLRLRIEHAPNENVRDQVRYTLGCALEQQGQLAEAATLLRAVQHTNLLRNAEQRLAAIEQKRGSQKAAAK